MKPRIKLNLTLRRVAIQLIDWLHEPAKTRGPCDQRYLLREMRNGIEKEVSARFRDLLEVTKFQQHTLHEEPGLNRLKADSWHSAERETAYLCACPLG